MQENSPTMLNWTGSVGGGALCGNHFWSFEVSTVNGEGWTLFSHGEDFTGPLAFLFWDRSPLVTYWTRGQFETFNADLKRRVEEGAKE